MLADSAGMLNAQPPYRKSYLVPIVERVPFVNPRWFKGLKYFGGFGRGQNVEAVRSSRSARSACSICYESIFPQRSREYRREGAKLIVNITNDAWFGKSLAPYQHEAHMALRAIENRVGIVRAANTGISGYIDPLGRIQGETQLEVAGLARVQRADDGRDDAVRAHRRLARHARAARDRARTRVGALPPARTMTGLSIGIDVGGTFTDLVSIGSDGRVESRKRLTTADDQSEGVLDALAVARRAALERRATRARHDGRDEHAARAHGCARRAVRDEGRDGSARAAPAGARVALRSHASSSRAARAVIVDRRDRRAHHAASHRDAALARARSRMRSTAVRAAAPEVVAISLLHSYRDDSHERALAKALREGGIDADIVCSADVLPEIREYERTATTVAEAYLRPGVARYLARLGESVRAQGYPALSVMTSSGGMRGASDAAKSAASLALSGPAGGVAGAAYVARLAGFPNALTIDIGGTSADAGLVLDGEPLMESGGDIAGVPIALPRVLVETVSAGGGSIGWVDDGGALRVGPRSAGATPGPAAFGRGGTEPTVTDAQIVLGTLTARTLGVVALDAAAAHAAVERLATTLGVTPERAARAMVQAADAAMARALRRVSVERGVDPRRCALVAFGGGGPLHACALADHLGVRTVLVPPFAGVLSALGLAIAPERRDALASVMRRASELTAADTRELDTLLLARAERRRAGAERVRVAHDSALAARAIRGAGARARDSVRAGRGGRVAHRRGSLRSTRSGWASRSTQEIEVIGARIAVSGAAREPVLAAPHFAGRDASRTRRDRARRCDALRCGRMDGARAARLVGGSWSAAHEWRAASGASARANRVATRSTCSSSR